MRNNQNTNQNQLEESDEIPLEHLEEYNRLMELHEKMCEKMKEVMPLEYEMRGKLWELEKKLKWKARSKMMNKIYNMSEKMMNECRPRKWNDD